MRNIAIATLLAAAASSASAGDVDVHFGFRSGGGVQIGVGYHDHDHGYRGRGHAYGRRGHYDLVEHKVWVPGYWTEVHRPAEYAWRRDHCGNVVKVLVRPARCERVWVPGRYEVRTEKVWHQGSHRRHH